MDQSDIYLLYIKAVEAGVGVTHASKCAAEIQRRVDRGQSHDCDEYRELLRADIDHVREAFGIPS